MAKKADKKEQEVELKKFTMQTEDKNKPFKVVAPEDSLDKDGNAEEALQGTFRKG